MIKKVVLVCTLFVLFFFYLPESFGKTKEPFGIKHRYGNFTISITGPNDKYEEIYRAEMIGMYCNRFLESIRFEADSVDLDLIYAPNCNRRKFMMKTYAEKDISDMTYNELRKIRITLISNSFKAKEVLKILFSSLAVSKDHKGEFNIQIRGDSVSFVGSDSVFFRVDKRIIDSITKVTSIAFLQTFSNLALQYTFVNDMYIFLDQRSADTIVVIPRIFQILPVDSFLTIVFDTDSSFYILSNNSESNHQKFCFLSNTSTCGFYDVYRFDSNTILLCEVISRPSYEVDMNCKYFSLSLNAFLDGESVINMMSHELPPQFDRRMPLIN